jgi:hypothetical protein
MADPIWSTSRPLPRKNRAGRWLLNLFDLFQSLTAATFKHPLLKAFTIGSIRTRVITAPQASQIGRLNGFERELSCKDMARTQNILALSRIICLSGSRQIVDKIRFRIATGLKSHLWEVISMMEMNGGNGTR